MKNLFLIFAHFVTAICICQNIKIDSNKQFTVNEIDSICAKKGHGFISDGVIRLETETEIDKIKTKFLSGSGGYSYRFYLNHFNEENYNLLSNIEKRKYDFDKYTNLIKGEYHQSIHYLNSYSEVVTGEFYYFETTLFYVKIKIIRTEDNKKDILETYNYSIAELNNSKEMQTISFELKSWVNTKNEQIIKYYNQK
jgi:hypothetical protein